MKGPQLYDKTTGWPAIAAAVVYQGPECPSKVRGSFTTLRDKLEPADSARVAYTLLVVVIESLGRLTLFDEQPAAKLARIKEQLQAAKTELGPLVGIKDMEVGPL